MTTNDPIEDIIGDSEEFQEAMRRANLGVYDHTIFEHWVQILSEQIGGTFKPKTMPFVDSMLRSFPYLQYSDLDPFLTDQAGRMQELLDIIEGILDTYEGGRDQVFLEVEDDGELHKELYREAIIQLSRAVNAWAQDWVDDRESDERTKLYTMASITISTNMVQGQTGLLQYLGNLAGLEFTDEDEKAIKAALTEDNDE